MKQTMLEQVRTARRVNVPIISISTPDPAATIKTITAFYDTLKGDQEVTMLQWDCIRGAVPLNTKGKKAIEVLLKPIDSERTELDDPAILCQLTDMLHRCARVDQNGKTTGRLPARSILFITNAHRHVVVENPAAIQAAWNCRDPFKNNFRTLIFLAPFYQPPAELADDILPIEEMLPTVQELTTVVTSNYEGARKSQPSIPELKPAELEKAVDALRGLSQFVSEQVVSLALTKDGINIDTLWERKRKMIESTPGLSVWRGGERFSDIGGVANLKKFLSHVLTGNGAPRCCVIIDEIEKALAGSSGAVSDSTGVSQAMLGILLSYMEDKQVAGLILVGPPGVGKTNVAKAAANEVEIPTVVLDLAGTKNALVGESEANLRRALRVISAVSDDAAIFIATSNGISSLPPELRRRFQLSVVFCDLPTEDERATIWDLYIKKYGLDTQQPKPSDDGYSGAEIKACCNIAWRLKLTLVDAAMYVAPVAISAREVIQRLRQGASNRFISASYPGFYKYRPIKNVDEVETIPFEPTGKGREYELN